MALKKMREEEQSQEMLQEELNNAVTYKGKKKQTKKVTKKKKRATSVQRILIKMKNQVLGSSGMSDLWVVVCALVFSTHRAVIFYTT